jgi:hypothetical protein
MEDAAPIVDFARKTGVGLFAHFSFGRLNEGEPNLPSVSTSRKGENQILVYFLPGGPHTNSPAHDLVCT